MKNIKILKLLIIIFLLTFCFSSSCTNANSIDSYKKRKMQELDLYVTNINYRDYDYENWTRINNLVISFDIQIKSLEKIKDIDDEYDKVIYQIESVNKSSSTPYQVDFNNISHNAHILSAKTLEYVKIVVIIDNYKDMNELFDNYQIMYDGWNDTSFLEEFNDDYFLDKSLIIYINNFTGSNVKRFIDDVYKKDDSITLHLRCIPESDAINDDSFYLMFLIEVERDVLKGINKAYAI